MEPDTNLHPAVAKPEPFRDSGKETSQLNAPIVSIAPASEDSAEHDDWTKPKTDDSYKHIIVDNASDFMFDVKNENKVGYPYEDLEPGQGIFIATKPGKTTDALLSRINKNLYHLRQKYSEPEYTANGDTILSQVTVEVKKRNDDGTIQLSNGEPIKGANFEQHQVRIPWRNYVAKPVVKNQTIGTDTKAPHDGVLIVRVL